MLREVSNVTDIEILLYVIGGLSVVAFAWSLVDVRRRKSREKMQKD